jgi:hypothetical protein
MCFSAMASFTGGVIICSIGVATIRKVYAPSQIVFACIPIFFGIQQIVEGIVWMSFQNSEYAGFQKPASYLFLVMADLFWPIMTPLAMLLMEKELKRTKILKLLLSIGILLSVYNAYCLYSFVVEPSIVGYHIDYHVAFPELLRLPAFGVYLISSVVPLFVSSVKGTRVMGILMTLSCLITILFFTQYLTSVWCFFAAAISMVIFWMVKVEKNIHFVERKI